MLLQLVSLLIALPLQMGGGGAGGGAGGDFLGAPLPPDSFIISVLDAQPAAPLGSSAFARLDIGLDKSQQVVVRVFGLQAGTHDVVRIGADGTSLLGSITVGADGMGKLFPDPPPADDFLHWFLFTDTIEIRQGADVLFSRWLDTPSFGVLAPDAGLLDSVRLVAVGDDLDARGRLLHSRTSGQFTTDLRLERVAPGPYVLELDGEPALYVVAGAGGKASVRLTLPVQPGTGLLNVFPVGDDVRLVDAAGHAVLAAQMPGFLKGPLHHAAKSQKFRDVGDGAADGLQVDFIRQGGDFAGIVKHSSVAWQRDALGQATLTVELEGKLVSGPPYELFVGDTWIGDLAVPSGEEDEPFSATLVVDPGLDLRAQRVEIRMLDAEPLALYFPQSVPAGLRTYHKDVRKPHYLRLDLLNPGIDLDATGLVDWRSKKGVETLRLVIRDLPAGAYDLLLDGAVVAPGLLVVDEDGGEDEVLLSTGGAVAGSMPLDFAVHGALEIRAAGSAATVLQQALGD